MHPLYFKIQELRGKVYILIGGVHSYRRTGRFLLEPTQEMLRGEDTDEVMLIVDCHQLEFLWLNDLELDFLQWKSAMCCSLSDSCGEKGR